MGKKNFNDQFRSFARSFGDGETSIDSLMGQGPAEEKCGGQSAVSGAESARRRHDIRYRNVGRPVSGERREAIKPLGLRLRESVIEDFRNLAFERGVTFVDLFESMVEREKKGE